MNKCKHSQLSSDCTYAHSSGYSLEEFPLCSPLLLVSCNGGSYFSPPASASPLSSFPHRSDGRLGKGISRPHCWLPHPRRTQALPRVWALPSPVGTQSHLTQTPTDNHRSPVRCARHHQSKAHHICCQRHWISPNIGT